MVTSESNRTQIPASPPYERPARSFAPLAETSAEPRPAQGVFFAHDPFGSPSTVVATATIGAMWGLGAVVLSIVGLSGVVPFYLAAVAGIVLGLAFVSLGAVDSEWDRMFRFAAHGGHRERLIFSVGLGSVLIAGVAAVVLSILSLTPYASAQFSAVVAIVLGLGLLAHSAVMQRVGCFTLRGLDVQRYSGPLAINALSIAPVRDVLIGAGSVILGILAILHIAPVTLDFVALLVLGGGAAFTISTLCGAALANWERNCSAAAASSIESTARMTP